MELEQLVDNPAHMRHLRRFSVIAKLLDAQFRVPLTRWRFGLDGLLGLAPGAGDIVTALGGRPVTGQGDVQRLSRDFADGGTIPLTVERGGQTLPLSVTVAPK